MKVDPVDLGPGVGAWFTRREQSGSAAPPAPLAPPGNLSHHRPHRPIDLAGDRRGVARTIGQPVARWHFMRQVHGANVRVVDDALPAGTELRGVDAAVTRLPDRPLVVTVADCLPVLIAGHHAVGVAHAGRQGLVAGVLSAIVTALADLDEDPGHLRAAIGASIGPCCYEVPEAMRDDVERQHPSARASTTWGTPSVDLATAAVVALGALGVGDVTTAKGCTMCDPLGRWFSHRADPSTGRFAGIVVRRRRRDQVGPGS